MASLRNKIVGTILGLVSAASVYAQNIEINIKDTFDANKDGYFEVINASLYKNKKPYITLITEDSDRDSESDYIGVKSLIKHIGSIESEEIHINKSDIMYGVTFITSFEEEYGFPVINQIYSKKNKVKIMDKMERIMDKDDEKKIRKFTAQDIESFLREEYIKKCEPQDY